MPLTLASFTYNAAWNIGNARGNVGKYWQKLWMQKQWWIWVYINSSQIVSLAYYCYWHRKSLSLPPTCRLPEKWWRQRRRKSFSTFSMWNSSFLLTIWNSSGFQTSGAGQGYAQLIIIIKQAARRQATQHHPSWVIKILGLKSVDSKLCFNWRVWNEIPVSTVLCWQNGKYVLIPICDHYHYIKLQLSTPTTGPQKGRM